MINKKTKICISIAECPGNFGATFHNMGYNALSLDYIYIPRKIKAEQLEDAINAVRVLGIVGCSVSMPHKVNVIKFLDSLDFSAERIGAVNTIVHQADGSLKGYNTDFYGAKRLIQEKFDIKDRRVFLIGAGGVANAISFAVNDLGGDLTIINRTYEKAKELADKVGARVIPWEELHSAKGDMLINATPVGMNDPESMIVSSDIIEKFEIVQDVVTSPARTKLIEKAHRIGKAIIPGAHMCVYQAAEQFLLYTGCEVPKNVVSEVLKEMDS